MFKECLWCKEEYNPNVTHSLFCSNLCADCWDTWYYFIVIVLSIDDGSFFAVGDEMESS